MSREVWVWDDEKQKVVLREERTPRPSKSAHVISDYLPPLKHMATGVVSESKSHHRRMTRDTGNIEVGTDPAALRPQKWEPPSMGDYAQEVKRAIQEVRSR